MDSKLLVVLTVLVVAVAWANGAELGQRKKRSDMFNELDADVNELENLNERDLLDLELEMRGAAEETRDTEKRAWYNCAKIFEECHALKHCCGELKCSRENIFKKGVCLRYFE